MVECQSANEEPGLNGRPRSATVRVSSGKWLSPSRPQFPYLKNDRLDPIISKFLPVP